MGIIKVTFDIELERSADKLYVKDILDDMAEDFQMVNGDRITNIKFEEINATKKEEEDEQRDNHSR